MKIYKFLNVILISTLLVSCARMTSIHRKLDVSNGEGVLIDIKQRAIIANKVENRNGTFQIAVCAEPSPDSMAALSATLAGDFNTSNNVKAGLAASLQEGASFVGLRTQSIQLLRDAMFRYCEMYMNGAISPDQYQLLLRRNQRYMVALLAIEQLTGAVAVPPITINTQGSAELARDNAGLVDEKSKIETELVTIETEKENLVAERDDTENIVTEERKVEINTEIGLLDKKSKELNKNLIAVKASLEKGRNSLAKGETTVNVSTIGQSTKRSDSHIQTVASTVSLITNNILDTDDLGFLCLSALLNGNLYYSDDSIKDTKDVCIKRLQVLNEIMNVRNQEKLLNIKSEQQRLELGSTSGAGMPAFTYPPGNTRHWNNSAYLNSFDHGDNRADTPWDELIDSQNNDGTKGDGDVDPDLKDK